MIISDADDSQISFLDFFDSQCTTVREAPSLTAVLESEHTHTHTIIFNQTGNALEMCRCRNNNFLVGNCLALYQPVIHIYNRSINKSMVGIRFFSQFCPSEHMSLLHRLCLAIMCANMTSSRKLKTRSI